MKYGINILKVFAVLILAGCCSSGEEPSEAEIEREVMATFEALWDAFARNDVEDFASFYHEDVIRMGTDGNYVKGREKFKQGCYEVYEEYRTELAEFSRPTVLVGKDQTVTFNTYEEWYIKLDAPDTSVTKATWIAVWKKQPDGSWKIVMTTWH